MKLFKKTVSLLLAGAMAAGLLAGCSGSSTSSGSGSSSDTQSAAQTEESASGEAHKIAVIFNAMGSSELQMKDYLENYVGPAYNTEFMFSEIIKDSGAAVTFIEQARAAGCEGILNFNSDTQEQATATANDAGMYVLTQTNKIPDSIKDMPYNLGSLGSSVDETVAAYSDMVESVLSDGQPHNVIIVSGGSAQGNIQHNETTIAILNILQETYGLTYDKSVEELAASDVQTVVETGTDIKIAIYPGFAGTDTYVTGFSSLLQTGDYDTVMATYAIYSQLMQPISEVEKALGTDIKMVSIADISDSTKTAFEEGMLDGAVVTPCCMQVGAMFSVMYNALEGNAQAIQQDGKASQFMMLKWPCANAEEYTTIEQLDITPETYALKTENIDQLLVSKNPEMNYENFNAYIESLTAEQVAQNSGL